METNPILGIVEQMTDDWSVISKKESIKLIRILTESENYEMVDAFFEYMLALDIDYDDFVFCSDNVYTTLDEFCYGIVEEINTEVELWNTADIPEEIPATELEWKIDKTYNDPIEYLVSNLNSFVNYLFPKKEHNLCLILRNPMFTKKSVKDFFSLLLSSSLSPQIIIGVVDFKEKPLYNGLIGIFPNDIETLIPDIDLGKAIEQIAEQNASEEKSDSIYRVHLARLMNKARERDSAGILEEGKVCLSLASKEVEKDPNWLSQIVVIYTILYNDKIRTKDFEDALYFSDKSVEAATYSVGHVEPSMSFRLVGQTRMGKGGILSVMKKWKQAFEEYEIASVSYANCNDYLMQCEALRLAAWAKENDGNDKEATEYYVKAFHLVDYLLPDIAKNSTFLLVVKKLINNSYRMKILSDKEMETKLVPVLGENWIEVVKSFGKLENKNDEE